MEVSSHRDRVADRYIKYAAVMGLSVELKLVGNDFTNASTSFFIAYLIAEVPNSMSKQYLPLSEDVELAVYLYKHNSIPFAKGPSRKMARLQRHHLGCRCRCN